MTSQPLIPSSSDVSLPFSTTNSTPTQSTSVVVSGSSTSVFSIPHLPFFSPLLSLQNVGPSIHPGSSIGQISLPSLPPNTGTIEPTIPSPFHSVAALAVPNITNLQVSPLYSSWVRVDQSVRSWLFATLSHEVLVDVHLLPTSRDIWLSLLRRFMDASQAKSIELKRQLTTMRKLGSMSIDQYLREVKTTVDSLAAINSPVSS
ncbi:hypothetical protein H5410_006566 [Solanum commersonii]|uniref:Retrotransposon gag domain-containing protein n=1 Tax=Solanum commersonii TaxID=4109 RepID=A0A9J6AAM2_SOLCO|nr:hypothetical protein H5410_006566 [Solanum commersonii]